MTQNTSTNGIIIPSNPADIKKIEDAISEAVDCMIRMDSEKLAIKAIIEELVESFPDIDAKFFRRLMKDRFKNSFDDTSVENDDYEALYASVFG